MRNHIDIQHHFLQVLVNDGFIEFKFCPTDDQLENIFTKSLLKDQFLNIQKKFRIQPI